MTIWLFFLFLSPQKVDLNEVRDLFTQIGESETANEQLFILTDGYTMDYDPVVFGYHAASIMTKANYCFWPGEKWGCFSEGKDKLEEVIKAYPDKLELKYIRYAVQKSSPSFLGYDDHLKTDKAELMNKLNNQDWSTSFKRQVKAIINSE